jgi:hypothetical protein
MNGVEAVEYLEGPVWTGDSPVGPENAAEFNATPTQRITDCAAAVRFVVFSPRGPRGVWGYRDCREGKKDKARIFKTLAARCALSVKSSYEDMRDCHNASAAMVEVLKGSGFTDAMVVGCSVLAGNHSGPTLLMGQLSLSEQPGHSVVVVDGHLIDPTVGQFRSPKVTLPDYLVLPASIAAPMLTLNRRWLERRHGEIYMHSSRNSGTDFIIAYIPTDPVYQCAVSEDWRGGRPL